MNPKIEVEVGANINGLKAGASQAGVIINKIGDAANSAAPQVNKLARATSNYNGVGIEFSRIIQDAPFGIIGVGNNITQLAGSFQNLKNQTGSASQALKLGLQSIISPANLVVLGVSAVTTAFTFYALSAQKAKPEIEALEKAQDAFNETLKETDRLLGADVLAGFLKEVGLIEKQNIGGRLIDVPTFTNAGQVVDALAGKIQNLRKGELDLLAKFLQTEISNATRAAANATGDLTKELASKDIDLYSGLLSKINEQLAFYDKETKKSTKSTKDLKEVISSFSTDPLVDGYFEAIRVGAEFRKSIENAANALVEDQAKTKINPISGVFELGDLAKGFDPTEKALESLDKVKIKVDELSGAFGGLGSLIGSAFDNPQLGSFLGEFLGFASKLIAANFKIAASSAIAGAASSAAATGPGAIFTLPAFIASAVGLVAGAFAAFGGSGRGASGVGTSAVGSSFSGTGGSTGFSSERNINLVGSFRIAGNDLLYVIDRSKESQV